VEAAQRSPSLLAWTLDVIRPYWRRVSLLAGLSMIEVALSALQPWPLSLVVDSVLGGRDLPAWLVGWVPAWALESRFNLLVAIVAAGLLMQVGGLVVSMFHTQVQVDTGQRMVFDVRARLFEHLQSLSLAHHIKTHTGDSVYRLESDAYSVDNLVMSGLFPLASAILTLSVMFAILLRLDWAIALLSLSVVPFLYVCLRYYMTTMVDRTERVKELESRVVERLYESFSAIKLVKSFARETFELVRFGGVAREALDGRVKLTWEQSLFAVVVGAITITGTAGILVYGGWRVLEGQLTVGALLVVISYLQAVYGPLSSIAHTSGQSQTALAGVRRVRAMLALEPEAPPERPSRHAGRLKGAIRFEQVGFSYEPGTPILDDISFVADPGELVALVGLTGAGKTTLVSLIPRFFTADTGRVLVDGRDVRDYDLRSLRDQVGIVLQDPVLFGGTIADNLRYGRLDATDEEIEAAARAAHAHEFVSRLPHGYRSTIAESGGGLSGGERQRLSIARALVKDAPILILDEPTSSLDALSEQMVFDALKRLTAGRTTIVIAHRLSTVRDADRILVLDQGRVAAQGRHDELLGSNELYRRMCARLSVGRSLDEPEAVDELIQAARLS
jgi:ATP-binding cassette subfamily B protein/subfamily B ATP-binding cassette protein MsbA